MTRLVAIGAVVGFLLTVLGLWLFESSSPPSTTEAPRTDLIKVPGLGDVREKPLQFDQAPMRTGRVMLPVNDAPQAGGSATP